MAGRGTPPLALLTAAVISEIDVRRIQAELKGEGMVRGAGHHSIVRIPETDQWVIAYHRFRIPDGDGYHRETCLAPLRHDEPGRILPIDVFEAVPPLPATD
jgi:hypothetical protein